MGEQTPIEMPGKVNPKLVLQAVARYYSDRFFYTTVVIPEIIEPYHEDKDEVFDMVHFMMSHSTAQLILSTLRPIE